MSESIKPRERTAILQSLRAGVVPKVGLRHIQVGRKHEVQAIIRDFERIEEGGSAVRFVVGRFGAGKSFFLNLAQMIALERKIVVVRADVTPDRRLHSTGGQARSLYAELMRNMCIRSKPDGGALPSIVEQWIAQVDFSVKQQGGSDADVLKAISGELSCLQEHVSGFDFTTVVCKYMEGYQKGDERLTAAALRWLRGEFETKTEAREELGVRSIVDDHKIYDYLKLFGSFCRLAGYRGLLVSLDEMGVFSHRLNSAQARNANYEMILRIVNDCLQGYVSHIGFIFAGTDAFLEDKRRGMASYEALASRLAQNSFAKDGLIDLSGPVVKLDNLSLEDIYVLLYNIRLVFASGDPGKLAVPDEALTAFMQHCSVVLGSEYFRTPRDAVKAFVGLLSVLEQNPEARWESLLANATFDQSKDPESEAAESDDIPRASSGEQLATFKL